MTGTASLVVRLESNKITVLPLAVLPLPAPAHPLLPLTVLPLPAPHLMGVRRPLAKLRPRPKKAGSM